MGIENRLFLWTAIFPIVVLLYYFFRKKYVEKSVSSTLFWDEAMRETKVSPYLKHLQRNALFYLQMLALILFVLALLQPYWKSKAVSGEQVVFIVDTSASLLAEKDGATVFDLHKKEMVTLADALEGNPITIITTGHEPKIILNSETNSTVIQQAIKSLTVTYEHEEFPKMLSFIQSITSNQSAVVYYFTDSMDRSALPTTENEIKWIVKGAPKGLKNVSLNRFGATEISGKMTAIAQIMNETEQEQKGTITIYSNQEEQLTKQEITIPPKEQKLLSFPDLPVVQTLTAKLDVKDDYPVDNEMSIVIQPNKSEINVDGALHQLIPKAFQAMNFPVSIVPTEQIKTTSDESILVTNQTSFLDHKKAVLLIGRNDQQAKEVSGIVTVKKDHVFAYANIDDVFVQSLYPPFDGYETIAQVGDQPFIQRAPNGSIIVLADIEMTDWPLHPSFPLFLWSVKESLSSGSATIGTFTPNERRPESFTRLGGESKNSWEVYSQEGDYISTVSSGDVFHAPKKPGVYFIKSNGEEKKFTVQLQQQEKSMKQGTSFEIGQLVNGNKESSVNKRVTPLLIFFILLVMLVEWEVQRRRGFTN